MKRLPEEIGITISLDDFTAGHSGTSALSILPTGIIKFDKSILDSIERTNDSKKSKKIYKRLVELIKEKERKYMSMLEKDEFCKEKIKIENIEHRLYQIAQKGKYFLKDIVFIKNIDISKCSFDEYYKIIKSFGIEAEIDDYKLKWTTIIQGYNILDEYSYILAKYSENWDVKFIVNLKISQYEGNCGWEIYAEDVDTNFHPWIYNQIKKNKLSVNEQYTLSVDDLDNPKQIYIYSDKREKVVIPYID